jgi:Transposase IS116/IS110/IS902 family
VGDPRRFTEGGFARFNGSAPLPCSSGEGAGEPVRHRFNRYDNRRVNCVLHHMAVTELRCEPRARELYEHARHRGHQLPTGNYQLIAEVTHSNGANTTLQSEPLPITIGS